MISADKTISTNKLITTDRMAGKEKKFRKKQTDRWKSRTCEGNCNRGTSGSQRRTGTFNCTGDQQSWSCSDVVFRIGDFGNFQCAVAFSEVFFQSFTGSLDRHFSDNSGLEPDDPQKEICAAVSAELYCRGRIRNRDRYP